jgi:capsid protein
MSKLGKLISGIFKSAPESLIGFSNNGGGAGSGRVVHVEGYDGEKNFGEIGPVTNYVLDLPALRFRSWKAYLDSEIAQTVIERFITWEIGTGLKLQSLPNYAVLEQEGQKVDKEAQFHRGIEQRFKVWQNSKMGDFHGENTFNHICREAKKNAIVGGDVLVILRVVKGQLKTQLIDAQNIVSPMVNTDLQKGNNILNGVETDKKGKTIAFHVRNENDIFGTTRIKATNNGFRVAYLYKGLGYRLMDNRGIPLIVAVMESISKVERYKEATVGAAEEVAKIAYQVIHQNFSSGENPMEKQLAKAFDIDGGGENIPVDQAGNQLANNVAATTGKMAFNNPIGAEIKSMSTGNKELYFKEFYTVNWVVVCATLQIPSEIAMSKFDSNFSASRAALKDWEHTLNVSRTKFDEGFLTPIYELWTYLEVLRGKVKVPGLIDAYFEQNQYAIEAHLSHRFVGANVPHIDPLKEVKAERAKLGDLGKGLPLTTLEQATEVLNSGDSSVNMKQYEDELKQFNPPIPVVEPVIEK